MSDDAATERQCCACQKNEAKYSCACGEAHYCSETCQRVDWPQHKAACKPQVTASVQSDKADDNDDNAVKVVPVEVAARNDDDAVVSVTIVDENKVKEFADGPTKRQRGDKFNDESNQIDFASEYRNIFEALYDIRTPVRIEKDADGNEVRRGGELMFDWFVDILNGERSRGIQQNATDQAIEKWWDDHKDSTDNFTGFIPTNKAIARWAVEIGYAEPESDEFTGDVTGIDNILRADTIQNIVDDNETRLIILNHLTPDILPPTRGIEDIDGNVFRGFAALPRNEALEPLGPLRQQDLDQLEVTEDIEAFNRRYGKLEVRKVFERELRDRREDRQDETLSPYRIKFKRAQITADIRFDEALVTRAQNAYIYGIDRVLAKPPRLLKRTDRRDQNRKGGANQ